MGVIAEIIQTRCNCEGDEPCCLICKDTEKKIIAEIEKCVPKKREWNAEAEYDFKDKYQLAKYNQAISEILSNIKKLKEGNSE
jgi:hypothetical protein